MSKKNSKLAVDSSQLENMLESFLKNLSETDEFSNISVIGNRHATVSTHYKTLVQIAPMVQQVLKNSRNYEHLLFSKWKEEVKRIKDYFTYITLDKIGKESKSDEIAFQSDMMIKYEKLIALAETISKDPESLDDRKVLGDAKLSLVDLKII